MPEENTVLTGDAVVVETPAPEAAPDADTAVVPETDGLTPAETEETPAPDIETESEIQPDAETPAPETTSTTVDADPLASFEANPIPTKDEINKLRIPKEDKARLSNLTDIAETATKQLDEIGGEFGVKTFGKLAKLFTKAFATDVELGEAVVELVQSNDTVTSQFLTGGAQFILSQEHLATPLLQSVFGDNATVDNVKALLALHKADYFDKDDAHEFLKTGLPQTDAFQQLSGENERLTAELTQIRAALQDPQKLSELQRGTVAVNGEKAVKAFEGDFYTETPLKLKPFFDKASWGDGAHAKLVTELLQYRLKSDPAYKETEKYLRQHGAYQDGDSRVGMANANLHILKNKAEAQGLELVRELMKDLRQISENSRNNQLAKAKEIKAVAQKEAAPAEIPIRAETHEQRQARIDAEFKAKIKAAREAENAAVV